MKHLKHLESEHFERSEQSEHLKHTGTSEHSVHFNLPEHIHLQNAVQTYAACGGRVPLSA